MAKHHLIYKSVTADHVVNLESFDHRGDALREALLVARNLIDELSAKGVAHEGRIEVLDDVGELVLSFKIQAHSAARPLGMRAA